MASPKLRAFRGRAIYRALRVVSFVVQRLPLPVARAGGVLLGQLAWLVVRRYRRRALANIAIAFPDWPAPRRRATIRTMFRHLGVSLAETLWLLRIDRDRIREMTSYEGLENFDGIARGGRAAVAISGHCGNWEWVAQAIAAVVPLTTLHRERDDPQMNRFITEVRAHAGIATIDRGSTGSAREMIRALRDGGLLSFLVDQNIRAESVKVPFFGRPALTPIGPAKLAIRAGVPVICIFIERRGGRQFVRIEEPMATSKGDDPVALTARMTAAIEAQIRRAPEQWVWFHDRWRERPAWDVTPSS